MLITHEWISSIGGSENVFRELLAVFPDATAACVWNDMPGTFDRPVLESPLAASPARGRKAIALPFMPRMWANTSLEAYETVLASSHAFGHHVAGKAAREGRKAFAYVHTPARYVWAPEVEARGRGLAARAASRPLKRIDREAVDSRVDFAANSRYIRDRIERCWGVDARVIYPPVQVERIKATPLWADALVSGEEAVMNALPQEPFLLGASRLVSYKRLDQVIELGGKMGMPVVIAGSGPDEQQLRHLAASASVPVVFTGRVSDAQLYALYQAAALFVFLAIEDFGIMPVECLASGTPVLVNDVGGARESVLACAGGETAHSVRIDEEVVHAAERALAARVDLAAVDAFSVSRFAAQVASWVGA